MSIDYSWVPTADGGKANTGIPLTHGLGRPDLSSNTDLSDPDAPFIGWPLRRTCSEVSEWAEGVVWMCDNNWGGVGNVRNFILTCIRYAIEAGVTGLVVPSIGKRNDHNISDYMSGKEVRHFSYMFDEDNFREAMRENCPQITIYGSWLQIPNVTVPRDSLEPEIQKINPREYFNRESRDFLELDHHTDRFGDKFRAWVFHPENGKPPSATEPRIFRMIDWPGVLWEWPTWHDGPELANTFGGLLKFNKQVIRLGKKALANMHRFARDHASSVQHRRDTSTTRPSSIIHDTSAFLGVHLRTEADAEKFWPSYEEQEVAYLSKAEEMGFTVAYVATGNLSEARKFAEAARERLGVTVLTKVDLLDGADADEMASLSWDQQGLVDHVVLAGAEYFVGNSRSSFSILLAQKRHLMLGGLYTRPYKVRPGGYGRSMVVGPMEEYYDHWLFIWDAMWP
ncbi:hypothetical protein VSDG_09925 [Cytospora chrysosperma]|uniref:Alternative oxidase n=1 Tax=Cytospora chrysosperma TaxID=252740 RepID=A0A423V8M5_CYTCH|nr:hypothetical protein VSDG_09925 [Valsa sordida]